MIEIERLNKWLESHGRSSEGKFWYRLIWSNKIFENRYGTFCDFIEGTKILIREVTETRLVRKYSYINERWILEKWAPGNLTANRETPDALNGDYVPVYVFEDKRGNYLPPTEKALKFIIDYMEGKIKRDYEYSQKELDELEIDYQVESMDTHPIFSTSGPTRDSVAYTKGLKNVIE